MSKILIHNPLRIATMNDAQKELSGGHLLIENDIIIHLTTCRHSSVIWSKKIFHKSRKKDWVNYL